MRSFRQPLRVLAPLLLLAAVVSAEVVAKQQQQRDSTTSMSLEELDAQLQVGRPPSLVTNCITL